MTTLRQEIKDALLEALSEVKQTQVVVMPDSHSWSIKECADYLGISESHLRKIVSSGAIPFFRMGVRVQFHPSQIRNWEGTKGKLAKKSAEDLVNEETRSGKTRRRGAQS